MVRSWSLKVHTIFFLDDSSKDLSDYTPRTLEEAEKAYQYEQEEDSINLEEPLRYAAEHHYKYALYSYGHWILRKLETSKSIQDDIFKACNYLLMAAYRDVMELK